LKPRQAEFVLETDMGLRFLKLAVVYLFAGALLGLIMGMKENFAMVPVHAHMLLLGWASLALAGLIYHFYPAASLTRLAQWHFWLHNLALPAFLVGLGTLVTGHAAALPVVAVSSTCIVVSLGLFASNVLIHLNAKSGARL
jgi:cbb3-type cytochrome oxidase subunit 1